MLAHRTVAHLGAVHPDLVIVRHVVRHDGAPLLDLRLGTGTVARASQGADQGVPEPLRYLQPSRWSWS